MQKILKKHLEGLNEDAQLGLYTNKLAADRAVEAICETEPNRRFTMDELRAIVYDYDYLSAGLDELIRNNFV